MKTAIEWLANNIQEQLDIFFPGAILHDEMINQAKEIEKEHHEKTFNESRLTHPLIGFKHQSFNEYYNETFKSE